jgi:UDP-glucose 4-epimerase
VLPKWISKCIKGDAIEIFGDGEQTRDFTYVGTVTKIITDCISNTVLHPEPVNLAYGNNISLNQVTDLLKNDFPDLKVKHLSPRDGDVLHSKNNPKLIKSLYPNINVEKFETSLQETIKWFKSAKI